ncbi:hypothetical protein TNCV_140311 [Trichonephila clavipes]|uniref:Uncharacterized protein n=1 Tax=Trichonephila clavipes TaxID=2585209 RepID=A0A8X6RQ08_TRICX|nr:hypothetical protein TNCV_140311 [Trichonephila clavipes]
MSSNDHRTWDRKLRLVCKYYDNSSHWEDDAQMRKSRGPHQRIVGAIVKLLVKSVDGCAQSLDLCRVFRQLTSKQAQRCVDFLRTFRVIYLFT